MTWLRKLLLLLDGVVLDYDTKVMACHARIYAAIARN